MTRLEVRLEADAASILRVGQLALHRRRIYFEFDPDFLAGGVELSPLRLPAGPGLHTCEEVHLKGLPGVFDDSLPDGWGRLLMDRALVSRGVRVAELSPLDRLAYLGRATMGALTYHPCTEGDAASEAIDLQALATQALAVYEGRATEVLPALRRAGGSPGGARPKVLIGLSGERVVTGIDPLPDGYTPWLVKFATRDDPANTGPLEYAYARIARAAGLEVPEVRLLELAGGERCFAVRRFDRVDGRRVHVHSLAGLLHADYRLPNLDYEDLLRVALALTRNHQSARECLRRAIFNLLAHNRDDHGKNASFLIGPDGGWTLAPAYDLILAEGPGGEHTMTYHGEGRRPTGAQVERMAARASIDGDDARGILDEVRAGLGRWSREARAAGLPAAQAREVAERHAEVAAAAGLPPPRRPARSTRARSTGGRGRPPRGRTAS
ncbi:MAG: type II toxin-antitoxin system HipA family toxin [Nannocystaceae bacterium]